MKRIIVGFTGAFGSGTTFIVDNFFVPEDFIKLSLSTILKALYKKENKKSYENRQQLQEFGNSIRKKDIEALAKAVEEEIKKYPDKNIVIDSIRNPAEAKYFRDNHPEFILIGVFADYDVRWERVKDIYGNSKDKFDLDEIKDKGSFEPQFGQKISDCFFEADLIIRNNDFINCEETNKNYKAMESKLAGYLRAFRDPIKSKPTKTESLMAAAYVSGRDSRCKKRKVGAIITDRMEQIISSGYNGTPARLERSSDGKFVHIKLDECEDSTGGCFRDIKRKEIAAAIQKDLGLECDENSIKIIKNRVKLLEHCRALHGEERAIINLVGKGIDLEDATIYVTTFPCNLCANKIVQVGIKKVVYFEPYPVEEAKKILKDGHVNYEPFEGVTFRAFFKFFQYEP